jgi:hypothetical protein
MLKSTLSVYLLHGCFKVCWFHQVLHVRWIQKLVCLKKDHELYEVLVFGGLNLTATHFKLWRLSLNWFFNLLGFSLLSWHASCNASSVGLSCKHLWTAVTIWKTFCTQMRVA